jgi:hypothetical protein
MLLLPLNLSYHAVNGFALQSLCLWAKNIRSIYMNKNFFNFFYMALISAALSLLVLAGCDDPINDNSNWLAKERNPFIGTWTTTSTNMMGVTTTTKREFKIDGTIAVTATQGENEPVSSTVNYLIKDDILVVSQANSPYYIKYRFSVIDNNQINLVQDVTGSATSYRREGAENPGVNRTTVLAKGVSGYWRPSTATSASTMYDWYTFNTNGTYHVYHWMNNEPNYIDRGEFSYYIDSANNFVSITGQYTVRVFAGFTHNTSSSPKTIGWNDGEGRTFSEFDGKNFVIPKEKYYA